VNEGAPNLDLYPQDWMEEMIYIPADDDMQEIAGNVVSVSDAAHHAMSTGCQRISPRTTIQAVGSAVGILKLRIMQLFPNRE
jgi:hypothetical protein